MPSPFPGMDPWLESPDHFAGLHSQLVTYAVEQLQPQLLTRGYYVAPNERVWIEQSQRGILPDAAIVEHPPSVASQPTTVVDADRSVRVRRFKSDYRQPFLDIFDSQRHKLITSVEFISPTNKVKSLGRRLYRKKQREVQAAGVHLVEVDLLRHGRQVTLVPPDLAEQVKPWDYLICTWRSYEDEEFELYPVQLRERLPKIRIPLKPQDGEAGLNLQELLDRAYDAGPYRVSIDYSAAPAIGLTEADALWAEQLLAQSGRRKA